MRSRIISFFLSAVFSVSFASAGHADIFTAAEDEQFVPTLTDAAETGSLPQDADMEQIPDEMDAVVQDDLTTASADISVLMISETSPEAASTSQVAVTVEPAVEQAQDEDFASSIETGELDSTRGTEGVTAETLASITSSSINNDFNIVMNGVSNTTSDSFNNFNGVANNIQVTGPGAQVQTNTTINIYMLPE